MTSFYSSIQPLPEDPIFGLQIEFNKDPRGNKINLGIGAYQNNEGLWEVFSVVREAEKVLIGQNLNKEYLGIEGYSEYIEATQQLIFGQTGDNVFAAQTIGGTSALRMGGDFLSQNITKKIFLSNPTWPNHSRIFSHAGMSVEEYPYYDTKNRSFDYTGMCQKIQSMPSGSAILLHGCCHNPSGLDPSPEQWCELSRLIKKQKLFPFFDLAYQGFGIGIEEDAYPIRLFADEGHEMFVAYSYSKNSGLYGEGVGLLAAVTHSNSEANKVGTIIKGIIRGNYSNPPLHGARIVATVLQNSQLKTAWVNELAKIRSRIQTMRENLFNGLNGNRKDFEFLKHQRGMFSYSGLNGEQVSRLQSEYGIYMLKSGRINVSGLNEKNINKVVEAIHEVIKT